MMLCNNELTQFEPVFFSEKHVGDGLSEEARKKLLSYYDREVARKPGDLDNHDKRIALYAKQQDKQGVYSAILDLFLVEYASSTPKYVTRTKKSLTLGKELFSKQEYTVLSMAIETGRIQTLPLPEKAILAKGFDVGLPLVKQRMI